MNPNDSAIMKKALCRQNKRLIATPQLLCLFEKCLESKRSEASGHQTTEFASLSSVGKWNYVCGTVGAAWGYVGRFTTPRTTARRLALAWGLHCVLTDDAHDLDDMVTRATSIAFNEGFADPGQRIIVTAGLPLGTPGATNMLRIAYVGKNGATGS